LPLAEKVGPPQRSALAATLRATLPHTY